MSKLLQLPRELRDEIYTHLFTSTRLAFGKGNTSYLDVITLKSDPNSLAILRTCHQINQEARSLWIGQVLFSFESLEDLLDKLWPLPSVKLSSIRHLCTGGSPLKFHYRVDSVLKLLPSLHLDKLTILGPPNGPDGYYALQGLIKHGNGWKQLHFIAPNSSILSFGRVHLFMSDLYRRRPQPSTWNEVLLQRDGINSGANITIYRSTQPNCPGSVTNPRTRRMFEQSVLSAQDQENFGITTDDSLLAEDENGKEVLFIVKRGRCVDIGERDRRPHWLRELADDHVEY